MRRAGDRTAIWPLDPPGGGTWIGANDAGLAMFILNRTPRLRPVPLVRPPSRGTIIPSLLRSQSIQCGLDAAIALSPRVFEPFSLVMLQGTDVAVLTNAGDRIWLRTDVLSKPIVFTSSSLGDHVVSEARRALFTRMVAASSMPLGAQAAFHNHYWPERREISVRMTRPDAATVSYTIVDVVNGAVDMQYTPIRH